MSKDKTKLNKKYIVPYPIDKEISSTIWAAIQGADNTEIYRMNSDNESDKCGVSSRFWLQIIEDYLPGTWKIWS